MDSQMLVRKNARIAGVLYLLITLLGFWGIMYVPSQIIVNGNVQDTYQAIIEKEMLFRVGVFTHLINIVVFTSMVLILYRIFKPVHKFLATLMVALVVVHVPVMFTSEAISISALYIAKGTFMESLDLLQRQELVYMFLRISKLASVGIAILFWGLWLIPLGILVYKSGFMPKVFGIMLIMGGMAYITESTYFILLPGKGNFILGIFFYFYAVAEISFMLWLLIKGTMLATNEKKIAI